MDKNLLVEIFVPTAGEGGLIGTGYPVAKDRILTARHVLLPEDRDPQRPIEVRWYHQQGAAREWIATGDDAIVWEGGEDCDAAVLACTFPDGVVEWGLLSAEKPRDQWKWESEGFAEAGKRDDQTRRPVGMIGEVFSAADTAPEFELGAKYAVELPEGWRGASGSPVFVMGKIIGGVVTCPLDFDAQRLLAVPVWRLLEDQGFRDAIGFDERAERLEQVRRATAGHLEKAVKAMEALGAELEVGDRSGKPGVWAADLSHKLLEVPMAHAIQRCNRAHLRLCQDGADEGDVAAIEEVARELLPVLFDHAVIAGLRSKISGQGGALVSFPAATRTTTEIIMAGVDKRPALSVPRQIPSTSRKGSSPCQRPQNAGSTRPARSSRRPGTLSSLRCSSPRSSGSGSGDERRPSGGLRRRSWPVWPILRMGSPGHTTLCSTRLGRAQTAYTGEPR